MQHPTDAPNAEPVLATGADAPMSAEQSARLKQLSQDAYDLDAFSPQLTQSEAERRIATLEAKLKLLSEPPHTQ